MSEKPSRRDVFKIAGGAAAAGAGFEAARRVDTAKNGQQSDTEQTYGRPEEIPYDEVSKKTHYESGARIREKINAYKTQVLFDEESGQLVVLDEDGKTLEKLPGNREVVGVWVSSDGPSITFEYRDTSGFNFGVRVYKDIVNGKMTTESWDTGDLSLPALPREK